jgi:hypothetical protein
MIFFPPNGDTNIEKKQDRNWSKNEKKYGRK